jgi:tetratricopeptide (TPR) repeat protein
MPDSQQIDGSPDRKWKFGPLVIVAGIALAAIAIAVYVWPREEPRNDDAGQSMVAKEDEPAALSAWEKMVQASPYRNVQPGVKYVQDSTCADCHSEIAEAYATHPMGRSMGPTADINPIEQFTADARLPLKVDGLVYSIRRDDDAQIHRETRLSPAGDEALSIEFPAVYAIGSGRTGRSYVIERENHLFMSPLTWYAEHGWDLSPGYEVNNSHFNRPVVSECLFCHANQAHHVPGTLNEYASPVFSGHAIGCQRCHGPGELHVVEQLDGTADAERDLTIVNPADLSPPLRESVCQQCHLGGLVRVESRGRRREDFRPGLPWHAVEAVFLAANSKEATASPASGGDTDQDVDRFVGHVEQMHTSGCYAGSGGKLGCISCHDPHRLPAEPDKVEFYRARCLACHGEADCDLPAATRRERQSDDSCYACHMPQAKTQIRHAAATDHRIPRSPGAPSPRPATKPSPLWSPLIAFHTLTEGANKPNGDAADAPNSGRSPGDDERNLAVALVRGMDRHPEVIDRMLLPRAMELLALAIKRDPDDVPARDAYAFALARLGDLPTAVREMEAVLDREPLNETQLAATASMLMSGRNWSGAAGLWERARAVNPWIVRYWSELALCHARLGQWDHCAQICKLAIERFPDSFGARQMLIESHLVGGRAVEAEREYKRLIDLNPPKIDSVRQWWQNHPLRR